MKGLFLMTYKRFWSKYKDQFNPINEHPASLVVEKHGKKRKPIIRYAGKIMSLVEILIKNTKENAPLSREIQYRKDAVSVIPYNPFDGTVALGKQHQAGAELHPFMDPFLFGVFAGIKDHQETDAEAAIRELFEESEIQIEPKQLIPISGLPSFSSPGGSSERIRAFVALVKEPLVQKQGVGVESEDESIDTVVLSLEEALQAVFSGHIATNTALMTLYYIKAFQEELHKKALEIID